jgi:type IV secretory pathway VirB6-like protein
LVQVVMGWRRLKGKTVSWRLMERYEAMKKSKGSGRTIIAAARKAAVIIWHMLSERTEFAEDKMADGKLAKKAASMSMTEKPAKEALAERYEKPETTGCGKKEEQKTGVAGKKRKKAG